MKRYVWLMMLVGLGCASATANAAAVTWSLKGVITEANTIPAPFTEVSVGDEFEVLVTFKTDALLLGSLSFPPGELHYFDPSSIVMSIRIGTSEPVIIPWREGGSGNPYYGTALYMRDDSGDKASQGEPAAQDGYSFGLEFNAGYSVGILLRGSILDIVNGPELPVNPDPRIVDWELHRFQALAFDASVPNAEAAELLFGGNISEVQLVGLDPELPPPPVVDWGINAAVTAQRDWAGRFPDLVSDYDFYWSEEPNPRTSVEARFGPEDFDSGEYSAVVNVDLATLKIKGAGYYRGADTLTGPYMLGQMWDTLTFHLPPGMTTTTARFTYEATADTLLSDFNPGDEVSAIYLGNYQMSVSDGAILGIPEPLKRVTGPLGPATYLGGTYRHRQGLLLEYEVRDGEQLQIEYVAYFACYLLDPAAKCSVDFRNTATGGLELEPGVTFTSLSGMFLADTFGPTPEAEPYVFNGFFAPVDGAPTVNTVKAGRTVPIKWQLLDRSGYVSDPAAFKSLTSQAVGCSNGAPSDAVEESTTSGSSGLQYDTLTKQFQYNWKTASGWKGTCRRLVLELSDGQQKYASFHFQ